MRQPTSWTSDSRKRRSHRPAAGDTRRVVWADFPWSAPRPCRSARKSARPAVSAPRTVPHAGTSSADAGAHRTESRYGTGRDQPRHDHRLSTTAAAPSQPSQPCCNRGSRSRQLLKESAGSVPEDTMHTQPHRFWQTGFRTKAGGKRGVGPNETGQARHLTGPDLGF